VEIKEYNFPNADSLKNEIRLVALDENVSYATDKPHRHNYFELFYFTKGSGSHLIDLKEFPIKSGRVHVVAPGSVHLVKREKGSAGFVLLFTKSFLFSLPHVSPYPFIKTWQKQPVYLLSATAPHFEYLLGSLKRELDNKPDMPVVRSLLILLLTELARIGNTDFLQGKDSLTDRFFSTLEDEFIKEHGSSFYAKKLGCSLKTLNNALHEDYNTTSGKVIQERLVLEAKRLLIHTDWDVKEIAYALNFNDPAYFNKLFKSYQELTPAQFREQNI